MICPPLLSAFAEGDDERPAQISSYETIRSPVYVPDDVGLGDADLALESEQPTRHWTLKCDAFGSLDGASTDPLAHWRSQHQCRAWTIRKAKLKKSATPAQRDFAFDYEYLPRIPEPLQTPDCCALPVQRLAYQQREEANEPQHGANSVYMQL